MDLTAANILAYIAIAFACAFAVYFALLRLGQRRVALAACIALWTIKLVSIWFVDLEPLGRVSTYHGSDAELPGWLLGLGYFIQFGAWGALGAVLKLRGPQAARAPAASP